MSMNIRGVETVDICERTNTGKNSLMNALSLTCEYDSGSVASHRQVRHFKLETERAWPQDPVLFTVSVARFERTWSRLEERNRMLSSGRCCK
ncbi:hypothetical protein PR003_g8660 [Phytophthora rubi]|uniref:Uncharacterized protein n=1 Tax=Phytophthora rubi TaxID=129364 RepID=A0A6A4FID0_9STRA|nr:hypothetical protein PR003_g8660 [Phytophthora rubi]